MSRPALVIFDMAGTTVRDGGEVPAAFTAALRNAGVSVTAEQINGLRGASKRQAVLGLTPDGPDREARAARTYGDFVRILAAAYRGSAQAIPGAAETFAALRGADIKVALNTGFDRQITDLLIDALGWRNAVDGIVCGDDVRNGRPAPDLIHRAMSELGVDDAQRVANVGDTALDLNAAAAAGVRWNIGVLTGAHDRAKLERCPHTHLLASVGEVVPLLLA